MTEELTPDPNRLCSDDHPDCGLSDSGCRRSETILAWEAEHPGKYVSPEVVWGGRDLYLTVDGVIYYYKKYISFLLEDINRNLESDLADPEFIEFLANTRAIVPEVDPNNWPHTLDDVRAIISAAPNGMPKFIEETDKFFCFEAVGDTLVTAENVTSETVSLIKNTFTSDYTLPYMDPCDCLYLKDDKVFWTDILRWCKTTTPALRAGFILTGIDYYFYPYSALDSTTENLVNLYGPKFAAEYNKEFSIINL